MLRCESFGQWIPSFCVERALTLAFLMRSCTDALFPVRSCQVPPCTVGEATQQGSLHNLNERQDLCFRAAIAQLGERQTEDLKVPGSIPGLGSFHPQLTDA